MHIRKATIDDLNIIVKLRKQQLIDEGSNPIIDIDHDLETFFTNVITDESLYQLLAVENEEVIATGAIIYYPFPPSYINQSGERAYVTNIYTHPNFRGRGIAQQIISLLIKDAEARDIKKIFLAASPLGKPVYKKLGFEEAPEWMEINYDL
ncbi:GCN5 family acetyltransferase [Mammaliicoccus lentus]|jgi:ribosomal protein S18 acetylase RimI-like enzyme|uniref:GNAT family N-acetyltransferase n=1 Tax=Mammaliicoccus TaxID=2803850 RepID=UPI0002DB2C5D|nr:MULTISPECIES: GNAT family N-acetyltransferase [Mammaliicoccus]MBF0749083.1 GNAT family N-acetyltransferase [Mammaliicoccus lentus]MBW0763547.1 GNAT family N-acetyltransferase [Mammaliicoccus lentus]MBW0768846.1 GNAT family N-acetyltransferase [Mammaliicoccus lentus]MCR1871876.1 GNAT family N-acetyltransferase [Mammaliicoccus lentus]MEB8090869.1 GNAT family N-acetyltransferase [Mammaliicoccus lentus]